MTSTRKTLDLNDVADTIIVLARELGADEVCAGLSSSSYSEITRRDSQIEQAKESRSLAASVQLLVDDRFSTHSTSDLRSDALRSFLERAVAATRYLEPDPDRRLPDREELGLTEVELDLEDRTWEDGDPVPRRRRAESIEQAVKTRMADDPVRSITAYAWDGRSESAVAFSNGFRFSNTRTSFGMAATVSLEEPDGRLPESWGSCSMLHEDDLWTVDQLTDDLRTRAVAQLGSRPAKSGRYPMLLDRRVVSRVLGVLLAPLAGATIYEQRSCLADYLDKRIASSTFSMWDDPLIPRGAGSRNADGDGRPTALRSIVEDGVLKTFFIDVYNGRRLKRSPTTGSASNIVVPPGSRSVEELASELPKAILVDGFLGGNSNPTTGDFSFGIRGALLENGERVAAVSEMNVSGNILSLMERYTTAASDPWLLGSWRTPTLLFDDVQFSGT
jgi:PmbA protein